MKLCFLLLLLSACGPTAQEYECNKVLNFEYCRSRCADAGTPMRTFEQGLGYVKCECERSH